MIPLIDHSEKKYEATAVATAFRSTKIVIAKAKHTAATKRMMAVTRVRQFTPKLE